jgi:O-antigen/teichoic acid export membrane protein
MSLTQRVFKSGFWISALRVAVKGLGFIRLVVFARLLTPQDFGIMAVVLVSIDFLYQASNFAVSKALIQKEGDIEGYLGTSWIMGMCRGVLIYSILFFAAPLMASFFNNPDAAKYIRVAAFSPLVLAFGNPRMVYIERELEFQKKFIYEVIGTFLDILVSLVIAFIFRNVWALIAGLLAGNLARFILTYVIVKPFVKLHFDFAKATEIFHFGKWLFLNQILGFTSGRMGDVILGRLISVTSLGYYQMAMKVANLIPEELTHVLSQVLFPAYSKIKDDAGRFRNAVFRVGQLNSIIGLPMTILTCYFAPEIVLYVLGEQWISAIPIVRILAVNMLLGYIGSSFGPFFLSAGRTDIIFKLQIYTLLVLFPAMYLLTLQYGAVGTALALIVAKLAVFPVSRVIIFRMLNCSFFEYFKWVREAVLASSGMLGILFLFDYLTPVPPYPVIKTIVLFLLAIGGYYGLLLLFLSYYKSELRVYLSWQGLKKVLAAKTS